LSYIAWVFYRDFQRYFSKQFVPHMTPNAQMKFSGHLIFWITKVGYVMAYIVIPAVMWGWADALIGFVIAAVVCGITTSVVFQLAHVVEGTAFPVGDDAGNINQEWAVHQVNTTANFATGNRILFWLLGGLNFQVEHHLLPRISHIHYPQINKFVKETCQRYGVIYHEHSSMLQALVSHVMHLRRLGMQCVRRLHPFRCLNSATLTVAVLTYATLFLGMINFTTTIQKFDRKGEKTGWSYLE